MKPQIISIVGKSDSGKTTLLEKLIRDLTARGYKLGTAKHAHHGFDLDQMGKDSYRHRQAGAASTLVIAKDTVALMKDDDSDFAERMRTYLSDRDIIIVEGFKHLGLPKIEIFRKESKHKAPLFLKDDTLMAFVSDSAFEPDVPCFGLEDISAIADFIEDRFIRNNTGE